MEGIVTKIIAPNYEIIIKDNPSCTYLSFFMGAKEYFGFFYFCFVRSNIDCSTLG